MSGGGWVGQSCRSARRVDGVFDINSLNFHVSVGLLEGTLQVLCVEAQTLALWAWLTAFRWLLLVNECHLLMYLIFLNPLFSVYFSVSFSAFSAHL